LDKFIIWNRQNNLSLNINKCNVITFLCIDILISFDYTIDTCFVTKVNSIRDLGIIIDSNLSFTSHINTLIRKTFKILGFINRNTVDFKNINALKTLFFCSCKILFWVWINSLVSGHLNISHLLVLLKMFNIMSQNCCVTN